MANVFFDANIYFDLFKRKEFTPYFDVLSEVVKKNRLRIHFTSVNFDEFLICLNQNNFEKVREDFRKASILTNSGNCVEFPWWHVGRAVAIEFGFPVPELAFEYIGLCRKISLAASYNEVSAEIEREKSHLQEFKQNQVASREQILVLARHRIRDSKISANELFSPPLSDNFLTPIREAIWRALTKALVLRFKFPEECQQITYQQAVLRIPSVALYCDAQIGYLYRQLVEKVKTRGGDYFDMEQVVYLDIMDYWISNDKGAWANLEKFSNKEILNRILTLEQFIARLLNDDLRPCALSRTKQLYYTQTEQGIVLHEHE